MNPTILYPMANVVVAMVALSVLNVLPPGSVHPVLFWAALSICGLQLLANLIVAVAFLGADSIDDVFPEEDRKTPCVYPPDYHDPFPPGSGPAKDDTGKDERWW